MEIESVNLKWPWYLCLLTKREIYDTYNNTPNTVIAGDSNRLDNDLLMVFRNTSDAVFAAFPSLVFERF